MQRWAETCEGMGGWGGGDMGTFSVHVAGHGRVRQGRARGDSGHAAGLALASSGRVPQSHCAFSLPSPSLHPHPPLRCPCRFPSCSACCSRPARRRARRRRRCWMCAACSGGEGRTLSVSPRRQGPCQEPGLGCRKAAAGAVSMVCRSHGPLLCPPPPPPPPATTPGSATRLTVRPQSGRSRRQR